MTAKLCLFILLLASFIFSANASLRSFLRDELVVDEAKLLLLESLDWKKRDTGPLIDFSNMTICPQTYCDPVNSTYYNSTSLNYTTDTTYSTIDCPIVDNSYEADCYCGQTTPLSCAWSCSWYQWMEAEDWFSRQCPQVPSVDFSEVPKCAQSCISDQTFNYGCFTESRNCFCLLQSFFGCADNCNDEDHTTIDTWYMSLCNTTIDVAQNIIGGNFISTLNQTNSTLFTSLNNQHHHLHWYESLAIAVLVLTGVLFLVGLYLTLRVAEKSKLA